MKSDPVQGRGMARLCVGIGSVSVALEAGLANVALRDGRMERSADHPTDETRQLRVRLRVRILWNLLGRLLLTPHPGPHSSLEAAEKDQ